MAPPEGPQDDARQAAPLPEASDFFDMSLDNLCIVDFDGCFLRVNASWTRTLGWTTEELLARPSSALVHPEDLERTLASRARLHQGASMGPLRNRYVCRDGSYRWFEWRSVAGLDRRVVYAAARDVTEQVDAEERLRESQAQQSDLRRQLLIADRMAAVGTLAAGSAHEINNPLTVVSSNAALLLEVLGSLGSALPAAQLADLTQMATALSVGAEKIRTIVRGLQTFARVSEDRPAVVDVRHVLELALTMTANEIQQRAQLERAYGNTPPVVADHARLGQVFINVIINAAQAIPEGASTSHEIRIITSTDPEGQAVIEVRDTGPGIPAAIIDRVFDPFFTTKPIGIGTGLGLSICHNTVTSMGGAISLASEPGRGTIVRIVLPAAPSRPAEPSAPTTPVVRPRVRGAVLVIDDEPAIGSVLRRMLHDHDVTTTTRATEALALLDAGRHFDLIFSDLMMPEMSGMEFHDELTRRFPHLAERVVFISGGAFTPAANAFLDRVPNLKIDKPFDPPAVRALAQRFAG